MYYYAELNSVTRIVVQVFQTENQIVHKDYIQINSLDTSLVGKKYDEETNAFVDPSVQDRKKHTTDEIAYKTEDKWLSAKLDEMDAAIDLVSGGSTIFDAGTGTDSYKMKITDPTCVNTADGDFSFAMGVCNTAHAYNTVIGKFSKQDSTRGYQTNTNGDAFIIGNGLKSISTGTVTHSNGFRVTQAGAVYGLAAYNTTGADYAEMFEWLDGNPLNEDRTGKFVTLEGDKLKIADATDYILGVVTGCSSVIGNNPIDWDGRFQKDVYGRVLLDAEGIPITNEAYDETQHYVERVNRKEWATIGLLGQLVVEDDGTCLVNGYCKVLSGKATYAEEAENSYRVLKRVNNTHILILFK